MCHSLVVPLFTFPFGFVNFRMVSCGIPQCSASADLECNPFPRPLCKRCCLVYQKFSDCGPCSKCSHKVASITRYDIPTEDQHRQTWVAQQVCKLLRDEKMRAAEQTAQLVESQRELLGAFEEPDLSSESQSSSSSSSSSSLGVETELDLPAMRYNPREEIQRERVLRSRFSSNARSNPDLRSRASQRLTNVLDDLFERSPRRVPQSGPV